jgi:hypothetical protein
MREVPEIKQTPRGYTKTVKSLNLNTPREKQNKKKMAVNAFVCTA